MSWFNVGWLLLDLVIIAVLIPTVILQRRESGATLAWILAIVLVPFLGLLAFWVFATTRLRLRRREQRRVEARELTIVNRQGISRRQRLTEGVARVLAPLL